ncbi:hypothetical protein [Thermococcus paralvinellae]|uniref:hypothetical protein n=1 Tax=Thermococcus paralvinellae TaxID=582419 RepID=UPI0005B2B616|nr:hypothetical protein [Thermococcus paralvinellae]
MMSRKILLVLITVSVITGLVLFVPLPGTVFYKHTTYFWWGPSSPKEKTECGKGDAPFEFLEGIHYSNSNWNVAVEHSGDTEILTAKRSFLSNGGYGRTYQRLIIVKKNGRILKISYTARTGPSENAYKTVCETSENGTKKCQKVLMVYDLDSEKRIEFEIYYSVWDYLIACKTK